MLLVLGLVLVALGVLTALAVAGIVTGPQVLAGLFVVTMTWLSRRMRKFRRSTLRDLPVSPVARWSDVDENLDRTRWRRRR